MGKQKKSLDDNMDDVFANWAVGEKAKQNFELYQPDKEEDNNTPAFPPEQVHHPSKSLGEKRTFKNRPGDLSDTAFTPINDIPDQHFRSYFNTLHAVVLPQLSPMSALMFCILFGKSHGLNRNWCQMSFAEFQQIIGVSRNTIRTGLKSLVEGGWICIIADGCNEATTYGLNMPTPVDIEKE